MTSHWLIKEHNKGRSALVGHRTKGIKVLQERFFDGLKYKFDKEMSDACWVIAGSEFVARYDIYEYAHYHRNFNRLLRICDIQEQEIVALKDKKDTYNKMDFETYENDDDVACPVCMDDIHKKNFVYVSKCCKKPIHAHCMLYLEDKERCCLCRGKL